MRTALSSECNISRAVLVEGMCVLYDSARTDWFKAHETCANYGMHLVTVQSAEQMERMVKAVPSNITSELSQSREGLPAPPSYPSEINASPGIKLRDCGMKSFVCIPNNVAFWKCDLTDLDEFAQAFSWLENQLSLAGLVARCHSIGMHMATFQNNQTMEIALSAARNKSGRPNQNYWAGAMEQVENGLYYWMDDNSTVEPELWAPSEPQSPSTRRCVYLEQKSQRLRSETCHSVMGYMCEEDEVLVENQVNVI
ncbi:hypothetical protein Btru_039731 [Bulinus truncatus]|nr:hypothetical protein Btru_039731 [Bulinus truncatus]